MTQVRSALLAFLLLMGTACVSGNHRNDLVIGTGASAIPGAGALLSLSQRMHSGPSGRFDLFTDLTHQVVGEDANVQGRRGDTFDQIRVGMLWRHTPEEESTWTTRAGVAWLRAEGDPVFLKEAADYGGVFVGCGYEWTHGRHLAFGPELTLQAFEGEGSQGFGVIPELAWRILWKL